MKGVFGAKKLSSLLLAGMTVLLVLASTVPVMGHAAVKEARPAAGSVVTEAPAQVELTFSMAVEPGFSTFKVYRLEDGQASTVSKEWVSEALARRGDEPQRVDAGFRTASQSQRVVIDLVDTLEPGTYVVMWRVLAADTHVTEGHLVFQYQP